jgi:hypothetical protein
MRTKKKKARIIPTPKKIGGGGLDGKAKSVMQSFPKMALTNYDLIYLAKKHKIPNFRGVFMRDKLPSRGPKSREAAILNLDSSRGSGTHWVCYKKNGEFVRFFDSTGSSGPPSELVQYLKGSRIVFNTKSYQEPGSNLCGHLCLLYLMNLL